MPNDIRKLLESSLKTKELRPEDIPQLDLYMDQIISLMSTHLGDEGEKEPLTRTMIHNYSKAGVISPVKGKKYSKNQILQLLAVYSLKNTLTIAQIKRILSGVAQSGGDEQALARCFDLQLERRSAISEQLIDSMEHIAEENGLRLDTPADAMAFLLTLTDITDTLTAFASAITRNCFPEPPEKPGKTGKNRKK
ncbi:MAG: DUF1836 domain-containing protein [Eubacteriales bacterium]|nr:DUF1836 domain-containing protein [Eubacteriales bacterium]